MTISQTTQELLKAHAGRGFSNDPALLLRSKVRLLQTRSTKPKHGQGEPGLFLLPDESQTCTIEASRHFGRGLFDLRRALAGWQAYGPRALRPAGRRREGRLWLAAAQRKHARDGGAARRPVQRRRGRARPDRTGMRVARALNSDAKARANKHDVPIFGLAYEFASTELTNDRGQNYYSVTFNSSERLARRRGPPRRRSFRASAMCDLVEATHRRGEAGGRGPQKRNPAAPQHWAETAYHQRRRGAQSRRSAAAGRKLRRRRTTTTSRFEK